MADHFQFDRKSGFSQFLRMSFNFLLHILHSTNRIHLSSHELGNTRSHRECTGVPKFHNGRISVYSLEIHNPSNYVSPTSSPYPVPRSAVLISIYAEVRKNKYIYKIKLPVLNHPQHAEARCQTTSEKPTELRLPPKNLAMWSISGAENEIERESESSCVPLHRLVGCGLKNWKWIFDYLLAHL